MEKDTAEIVCLHYLRGAVDGCLTHGLSMKRAIELFSRELLIECLKRAGNNQSALADIEGVHRNTINRAMVNLGVAPPVKRKIRLSTGPNPGRS